MNKLLSRWLPLIFAVLVSPAFAGPLDASNWSSSVSYDNSGGYLPLNSVTIANNPDPSTLVLGFNYGMYDGGVPGFQMNFSTTAATDQVVNFTLDYSGFSAWYQANNWVYGYINGPSGNDTFYLGGWSITSQPESWQVYGGYTWGFLTGGSNSDSTSFIQNTITLTQVSVPEPASLALLGLGLAGLGFSRRKKQKAA